MLLQSTTRRFLQNRIRISRSHPTSFMGTGMGMAVCDCESGMVGIRTQARSVVFASRTRNRKNENENNDNDLDLRLETIKKLRDDPRDTSRNSGKKPKEKQRIPKKKTNSKNRRGYDAKIQESLDKQINMIEEFTAKLNKKLSVKKDEKMKEEVSVEIVDKEESKDEEEEQKNLEKDAEEIFKALIDDDEPIKKLNVSGFIENKTKEETNVELLFPETKTVVELPPGISNKVHNSLKYLANKETTNWVPVIKEISENEGFTNVKPSEVSKLLSIIPKNQRALVIEDFHKMVKDSGIFVTYGLTNGLMSSYNLAATKRQNRDLNSKYYETVEELYEYALTQHSDKLKISTFGIMINTYAKQKRIDKIKEILQEISNRGMKPTMVIYTTILQTYIRMNNYKLAQETFETMKFLSMNTFPSDITYTSMILMDIKNDNIEHALNLYDEMEKNNIKPNGQTILAMARACCNRPELYIQGWKFIMEYYRSGNEVNELVIEIMMKLSKENKDLEFVRSLYLRISETNTRMKGDLVIPGTYALRLLLKSYAYYEFDHHVPVTLLDEEIKMIRLRTMELTNYDFHPNAPPLLPMTLGSDKLILAECDAIWKYYLINSPNLINELILEDYLTVYYNKSKDVEKFIEIFEKYSFFQNDENTIGTISFEESGSSNNNNNTSGESELVVGENLPRMKKIPRSDVTYMTCMSAARKFKNLELAQRIWIERGKFRNSLIFQNFSKERQDYLDFKFAKAMLKCLVENKAIIDAYKLVLSCQNRFTWEYYDLKPLLILAETNGYDSIIIELKKVLKKANKRSR